MKSLLLARTRPEKGNSIFKVVCMTIQSIEA